MAKFNPKVEGMIIDVIQKLELENELIAPSFDLYNKVIKTPYIMMTRIKDKSFAIACVYITMKMYSKHELTQDVYAYHFGISTATIRKTYAVICRVMEIDRKKIVGKKANIKNI